MLSVTSTSFIRLFIFLLVWAGRGAARKKNRRPTCEPPYITAGRRALGANDPGGEGGLSSRLTAEREGASPATGLGDTPVSGCPQLPSKGKRQKVYTWGARDAGQEGPSCSHRAARPGPCHSSTGSQEAHAIPASPGDRRWPVEERSQRRPFLPAEAPRCHHR